MEVHAPCFERLHVSRDPVARSGAVNMALDEVLLDTAGDAVLLRLYGWAEPTVSFGCFETAASARQVACGRGVVRRWTGGGIVEHGEDLTYSLCVPRSCPFAALRGAESYRRIHAAVARALGRCGTSAASHEAPGTPTAASTVNACFERPVLHDLIDGGRKIAGGAQRRNRTGLLHQGSIRINFPNPDLLAAWKTSMGLELPFALGEHCEERGLTPENLSRAHALAAAKYATAAWTDRH